MYYDQTRFDSAVFFVLNENTQGSFLTYSTLSLRFVSSRRATTSEHHGGGGAADVFP